jgi:hypothetical protein
MPGARCDSEVDDVRDAVIWPGGLLIAVIMTACGGGQSNSIHPNPQPARGALLQNPPELAASVSTATLLARLVANIAPAGVPLDVSVAGSEYLLAQSGTLLCDIVSYHIRYTTVGGAGESTTASGALMVPSGLDSRCRGARPIVLYAHGTTTARAFNIADLNGQQNAESIFLAAFFVSQGYIVVAPNYAGYDTSTLPYHPYLVADQQSKDMIDALTAARSALPVAGAPLTTDDRRVLITGYSQGGYVAMATQRAMEAAGMQVTAAAPMSGPYALAAFVDGAFYGEVDGGAPVVATFLITAYQHAYANVYAGAADVFEAQYATGIESLLPSALLRHDLYAQGKLPQYSLFGPTPPGPSFVDSVTAPSTLAALAPVFALGFGADNLVKSSYRASYLADAQANPDGGWPVSTTGVAAASPGLPLRRALKQNDLRNWTPRAPVLLCGGDADPVVFWLNTQLMPGYWGVHAPAPASLGVLDLEAAAVANDPYGGPKHDFSLAKQLIAADAVLHGATDGGAVAVASAYHATLVAPFCFAAVKSFFDGR